MFCSKCGAENKDGVRFCSKCGAPMAAGSASAKAPVSSATSAPSTSNAGVGQFGASLNSSLSSNKTLIMLCAGVLVILALLLPFAKITFDSSAIMGDTGLKSSISLGFKDIFAATDLTGLSIKVIKSMPESSGSADSLGEAAAPLFIARALVFIWVNLIGAIVWGIADTLRGKGTKVLRIALIVAAVVLVLLAIATFVLRGNLIEESDGLAKLRPTFWCLLGIIAAIGAPVAEKQLHV